MNEGEHFYEFLIDHEFFDHFENSPLSDGKLLVKTVVDKRPSFISLVFNLEGTILADCDRCTASIDLPIDNRYEVLVKMRNADDSSDAAEDVIYISPLTEDLSIASLVYEVICLSVPMIKTVEDCENQNPSPCNQAVLKVLNQQENVEKEQGNNVFKDAFKNINLE